ncbi:hypothetical protein FSP39_015883 [Pinctada imbricata]|uniref:Uncharacterized protein n=1 Tax=Pinctada imbricata TaxID=66713 RepID=A0AA88XZ72_PINIB|nr:hypothetical protein FSP39_015883 [Pinctada imbricata]
MATSSAGDNGEVDVDAVMQENTEIDRTVPEPEVKPTRGPMNLPPLPTFNLQSSAKSNQDIVARDQKRMGVRAGVNFI